MPTTSPSVCIIAHNAYGAISGAKQGFIGGVEWQTSLLARWLASRGSRVSLLTWDEGGPKEELVDRVRVIKICRKNAGLPGMRFFHPKWTGLIGAMQAADANVYYHNCGECVTGQAALWCHRRRRAFVFSAASDADCDPRLPELRTARERMLYRCGLRLAERVVVQTLRQQANMREHFRREALVIPMPCPGPGNGDHVAPAMETKRVLWIGRVRPVKRPDRLLELAACFPELTFDLVGPLYPDEYSRTIREGAALLPNLTLHGAVNREEVGRFYRQAAVLCCTSEYEGFPNTFLEAWSHGLPTISTFDPDGLIGRRQLGMRVKDLLEMKTAIRSLMASPENYRTMSQNARRYYLDHHTVEAVMPRIESLLKDAAQSSPASS